MTDVPPMGHYTPDPRRKGIVLPDEVGRDDPTPVDGVRLDILASEAVPPDTMALVQDGKVVAVAKLDPAAFEVGGRRFTVGQEVTWRGSRWVVDGPDKRTGRSGRPCLKLRGYRYAVDAKEIVA